MKESKEHEYLRPRGLHIYIRASTGVTPPEPDQYWSVSITDSKLKGGRSVCCSSGEDTSMKSLKGLIRKAIKKWRSKFDEGSAKFDWLEAAPDA